MKKFRLIVVVVMFNTAATYAQQKDSLSSKYLSFGLGIPHWNFRDEASSSLAYQGRGALELNFSKMKMKLDRKFTQFNIEIGLGGAKPDIENRDDWNKSTYIIHYDLSYTHLRRVSPHGHSKTTFFVGGKLSSNAQYFVYPTINNNEPYSFNWGDLQPSGMAVRNYSFMGIEGQLSYQLSFSLLALNVRPTTYTGVLAAEYVWNQKGDNTKNYFDKGKLTSIHNNLIINSLFAWDINVRANKLRLSYSWLYHRNTVAVNQLSSVKSTVAISYLFNRKNRK